ncbi:MAG: SRPBCC family protein [Pseudomonadales bacterium]|nr:SRPBCC family protein [Pseudomonadales bacterium]
MNHAAEFRVTIALPRARAWEKLCDLGLAHHYVPGLVRTDITTSARIGVGASRRVYQSEARFLDETVIEWREGHGFVIRLHRGDQGAPAPFREATFRYWLDDAGDGNTSLCTTLAYTVRWGLLGKLLDRLVLAKAIRGSTRDVAICLKDFYERGVALDPARLQVLKQH